MSGLDRFGETAGTPGVAAGGALAESGPARVAYTVTDHGDWSHLVPEIAAAAAAHRAGDQLGAWVHRTSTRRRGDGPYPSATAPGTYGHRLLADRTLIVAGRAGPEATATPQSRPQSDESGHSMAATRSAALTSRSGLARARS